MDNITQITETLAAHQGSWDSWGWHCSCGTKERLSDLPIDFGVNPGKDRDAQAALLDHQARAVAGAVA